MASQVRCITPLHIIRNCVAKPCSDQEPLCVELLFQSKDALEVLRICWFTYVGSLPKNRRQVDATKNVGGHGAPLILRHPSPLKRNCRHKHTCARARTHKQDGRFHFSKDGCYINTAEWWMRETHNATSAATASSSASPTKVVNAHDGFHAMGHRKGKGTSGHKNIKCKLRNSARVPQLVSQSDLFAGQVGPQIMCMVLLPLLAIWT